MKGKVVGIYTAGTCGAQCVARAEVHLEPGRGIVGDRYYIGAGTFSKKLKDRPDAEITLIEKEQIDRFNDLVGLSLDYGEPRRNIVTSGVSLNELIGVTFRVGAARLQGIRLCEPCAYLAGLVSPRVLPGLVHRAGLRARVLAGGSVRPDDDVVIEAMA